VWIELAREKHAGRFQDLVRAAQLEHLTTQLADLFALVRVRQVGRIPLFASAWRTRLRKASGSIPKSEATWAVGAPTRPRV
jgi:hypothetical protein